MGCSTPMGSARSASPAACRSSPTSGGLFGSAPAAIEAGSSPRAMRFHNWTDQINKPLSALDTVSTSGTDANSESAIRTRARISRCRRTTAAAPFGTSGSVSGPKPLAEASSAMASASSAKAAKLFLLRFFFFLLPAAPGPCAGAGAFCACCAAAPRRKYLRSGFASKPAEGVPQPARPARRCAAVLENATTDVANINSLTSSGPSPAAPPPQPLRKICRMLATSVGTTTSQAAPCTWLGTALKPGVALDAGIP
mmetsp:Transcript_3677/g.13555  ORF Transcript_3677/g.13555 Transcript_3677/m.13555 type:complete len:254 (+) Transcript_3677:571-1332(+)